MPVHNADIARIFEEIAEVLELEEANPFRIRAYRTAARIIQNHAEEMHTLVERNADLTELPGIGKDLAAKIQEIVHTGTCQALEKLRKELPAGLTDLLQIPGLGPKRVHALYHELDIHTPEQLLRAAKDGRLQTLHGFGPKFIQTIIKNIESHIQRKPRIKLATAAQYAEPLAAYLRQQAGVAEVIVAGSYRRCKETVGDLDLLVCAEHSTPVIQAFVAYDEVATIQSQGGTRSTVVLRNGLQVDLRVVPRNSFGAALHYFTGSKAHNIELRRRAQQRGLKLNEYGVFKDEQQIAGQTEMSVFKAVDLPYIPPKLRENQGEIEAAEQGQLPLSRAQQTDRIIHALTRRASYAISHITGSRKSSATEN